MKGFSNIVVAALIGQVAAAPAPPPTAVVEDRAVKVSVALAPSSTVVGTSGLGVESFHGIPYALPPTGQLRLKPPVRLNASLGTFDASGIENACPQFFVSTGGNDLITQVLGDVVNLPFFQAVTKQSEDCLTINVVRPASVKKGDKLPVLFWIFGGGFEVSTSCKARNDYTGSDCDRKQLGWTSMYDGSSLVSNAIANGKPFVFVAVNYRVSCGIGPLNPQYYFPCL
jgi:carboxylesterase type B